MVRAIKRLNLLQIITLIALIIVYVLCNFNIKGMTDLFWIVLAFNMLGFLLFTTKWSKEGKTLYRRMDKNYNKNLTRKPSDIIFLTCVAFYILICFTIVSGAFIKGYEKDISTIFALLGSAWVFNLFTAYIVERTSKEVKSILKSNNHIRKD